MNSIDSFSFLFLFQFLKQVHALIDKHGQEPRMSYCRFLHRLLPDISSQLPPLSTKKERKKKEKKRKTSHHSQGKRGPNLSKPPFALGMKSKRGAKHRLAGPLACWPCFLFSRSLRLLYCTKGDEDGAWKKRQRDADPSQTQGVL
ncbi:hypothetical protein J3E68DRAFT_416854 [Trichoderma sp. SZMC 28012]